MDWTSLEASIFLCKAQNTEEKTMLTVNEYFDGKVKSLGLNNTTGKNTVGVMDIGDYEFGTSTVEYMTVVSGALNVLLPDAKDWKVFKAGETFIVPANCKFQLKVSEQTAYLCRYE
jgi:hypothetical protein